MSLFKNASPEYILLGADDKGSRPLPYARTPVGQHVPLIYMFAQKGTSIKTFANGATAVSMYGAESFNADGVYYQHTTQLAQEMYGVGNSCSVKRLIPTDAGPKANVVVYVDVLQTTVPNYVRDSAGSKVIDPATNAFIVDTVTPTIPGVRIKYIAEESGLANIGMAVSKTGTMAVGATTSTMYPLFELRAAEQGAYYNNIGFSLESMLADALNTTILNSTKAMTYKLALVARPSVGQVPQVVRSLFGEPSVVCSLQAGAKNPATGAKIDVKSVFDSNWFNTTDPLKSIRYNDYEGFHIYQNSLTTVLGIVMANEAAHISATPAVWNDGLSAATLAWFDFTTDVAADLANEHYLLNLFSGKSSKGVDYFTVVMDATAPTLTGTQREVHISRDTPIFLSGGSDGTLSKTMFENLVTVEMAKYLDPNSEVIDNAINLESHLYDSGFSLTVKQELLNFIAVRKDTVVALGTHEYVPGSKVLPLSATRANAVLLKTKAKLFPESDFYGTPVSRATVMGGGYRLYSSSTGDFYPTTFELAIKTAKLMGAGNFKWKSVNAFDHGVGAELRYGYDFQPSFIPAGIKPSLWAASLVWAQPKDRSTYFIPAVQTVYDNDTSPMNSWLTVCALATLNRISSDAWREFTGTSTMSDAEFKDAVLSYLNARIQGIFDGMMVVIPEVVISQADAQRGYSWGHTFRLYAGNMKTKMVSHTEVYRLSDLAA